MSMHVLPAPQPRVRSTRKPAPHVVAVVVTPGVPIFELAVPAEVFGIPRPELGDPWYAFRIVGLEPGPVRVAGAFSVEAECGLDGLEDADTIIVPACANLHDDVPAPLVEALRAAAGRGTRIAAICSGAFVLAAAGLLDRRQATTHWMHAEELRRRYPRVQVDASVLYIADGNVFTSAGTAAGLDLCLELVRRDRGATVANRLARRIVIPPHRSGGQAQYVEAPVPAADEGFAGLLDWALARLPEPLSVADLAKQAGVSERTLARRFAANIGVSPIQWLIAQRVRLAQELLESTERPIEQIAELSGFGTAAGLRDHFIRATGVRPAAYRRTFGRPVPAEQHLPRHREATASGRLLV